MKRKRKVKVKPRKPKPLHTGWLTAEIWDNAEGLDVKLIRTQTELPLYSGESRKLATWLLKAADWLDLKDERKA